MSAGWAIFLLSLLIGLQPLTTDLYLPALPALTAGFGAAMSQAQLTLTALVLAFGVSQLLWGPMADRFGRRPVLLLGMLAYVLASLACSLAPSMELLIVWRAVQGAAMGAAVVCARAVVRDLYEPAEGARVMSKCMSGLALIACSSPPSAACSVTCLAGVWRCWCWPFLAPPRLPCCSGALRRPCCKKILGRWRRPC